MAVTVIMCRMSGHGLLQNIGDIYMVELFSVETYAFFISCAVMAAVWLSSERKAAVEKKVEARYKAACAEMEQILQKGGEIRFFSKDAHTGTALMPDGTLLPVALPDRPDICFLNGMPEALSPEASVSLLLSPPEIIMIRTGKSAERTAQKVLEDTRQKCMLFKDAVWIAFPEDSRIMTGIDSKGNFIRAVFMESVKYLFKDLQGIKDHEGGYAEYLAGRITDTESLIEAETKGLPERIKNAGSEKPRKSVMPNNDAGGILDVYVTDDGSGKLVVSGYVLRTGDDPAAGSAAGMTGDEPDTVPFFDRDLHIAKESLSPEICGPKCVKFRRSRDSDEEYEWEFMPGDDMEHDEAFGSADLEEIRDRDFVSHVKTEDEEEEEENPRHTEQWIEHSHTCDKLESGKSGSDAAYAEFKLR